MPQVLSLKAAAAVLPYRAVHLVTSTVGQVQHSDGTKAAVGVTGKLGQDPGQIVDVVSWGRGEIEAGAAFAIGVLLRADSNGRAIEATVPSVNHVIGLALEAAGGAGEVVAIDVGRGRSA